MSDKIVMGYWDCPSCDSKGIPGTTYDCPNCGRQRGKETKFYMREGKVEYVLGHKVIGADWYCAYCGALNTAGKTVCENCGSPKDDAKDDYFSLQKPKPEPKPEPQPVQRSQPKKVHRSLWWRIRHMSIVTKAIIAFILFVILSNAFSNWVNKPRDYTFDVSEMSWENTIEIEELKTFRESDWYLPSGAELAYTDIEIRSYEKVLDHYETVTKSRTVQDGGHYESDYSDNGDGTFTEHETYVPDYSTEYYEEEEPVYRDEPIYDTRYYYDIDKWVHERDEKTSGTGKDTYWPELSLRDNERQENYDSEYKMKGTLHYKTLWFDRKKVQTYEINESWWDDIEEGQTLTLTFEGDRLTDYEHTK